MFFKRSSFLFLCLMPMLALAQPSYDQIVKQYIQQYSDIAVKEMMVYKVPASITLAQGIYESNAGRSRLATEGNNHFGIKCHKEWTGPTIISDDETRNECFRKYDNAEASFRDHSFFLTSRDRYKNLFKLEITDYKGWAVGLKDAGYATNPQYPEKLIKTIEKFELYRFDRIQGLIAVTENVEAPASLNDSSRNFDVFADGPGGRRVYLNNGLQFIILAPKDRLSTLATAFGVSQKRILKWNDLPKGSKLQPGQMVYLEPKKRRGNEESHTVTSGETLYSISQLQGIKLKILCRKNHLSPDEQPSPGVKLVLK